MFKDKAVLLHNMYIEVASRSNFPNIKWFHFCEWAEQYNHMPDLPDWKMLSSRIDRIFLACMSDIKGDAMFRYHFYEGIVRFAKAKY
jgi:hypothetical protein